MEAKEILKALSKSGMIEGGNVVQGKYLKPGLTMIEGRINGQKEYFYSFNDLVFINPTAVAYTESSEKVYIYEID